MNANAETTETAAVAEQSANAGPKATRKKAGKKGAKPAAAKKAAKASQGAKAPAKKVSKAKAAATPRQGSKKQIVIDLLNRKGGATMAEIAEATGWQKHSIRGFISGTLMKKMDLPVASVKNEAGDRVYRIEK